MIYAVLTSFLFASTALCATQSTRHFGPSLANLIRIIIALILLVAWSTIWGQSTQKEAILRFTASGMIGFGIGGWCMFRALVRIGSTLSLLVVECAAAVSASILAWLFLGANLSSGEILFGSISIAGVIIGMYPNKLPDIPKRKLLIGGCFATVAAIVQSISFVLSKSAFNLIQLSGETYNPLNAAMLRLFGGAGMALSIWLFIRVLKPKKPHERKLNNLKWKEGLPWATANAVLGPVLGVTCMLWAIREVGNPGLVQSIAATATLLSAPFSVRMENKTLHSKYYLGASMSILGTAGLLTLF